MLQYRFKNILFFILLLGICKVQAQEVYQPVSNKDLYDFIEELSNAGIIECNSAIKPYSRNLIAKKLNEAKILRTKLNRRQQLELDFYLKDFSKELPIDMLSGKRIDFLYHRDSLFTMSVNPVIGISGMTNRSGAWLTIGYGAEAFSYIGKKIGIYFGLRYNEESNALFYPLVLNQMDGYRYNSSRLTEGGKQEIRAGISYSWKEGSLSLRRDHFIQGESARASNVFSGRQPAFPMVSFHQSILRWLQVDYIHGWLTSGMRDSLRTYYPGNTSAGNLPKDLSANILTVNPGKKFQLSLGNSIIYSDRHIQAVYLLPALNALGIHAGPSENGDAGFSSEQFFISLSSRHVRNLHIYSNLFCAGFSSDQVVQTKKISHAWSGQLGAKWSNPGCSNLFFTTEFTYTQPWVYRSTNPLSEFSSDGINLGHDLGDNAKELFCSIGFRPRSRLYLEISWILAQKGPAILSSGIGGDSILTTRLIPFVNNQAFHGTEFSFSCRYQVINDAWLFAGCSFTDYVTSSISQNKMPPLAGNYSSLLMGARIGF